MNILYNYDNYKDPLKQFPYSLTLEKHCITFDLLQPDGCCTQLSVGRYTSINELLYALLYDEKWEQHLSKLWRPAAFRAIENVYFFEHRNAFWLTKSERYMLYLQYPFKDADLLHILEFSVHHRKDRIAEDMVVPVLKKYEKKFGPDKELPSFNSYENMLRAVENVQIRVPTKDIFAFPTADDLASWVFQKVIDSEKDIKICPWCGRYFIPDKADTQYCSKKCRQSKISSGRFCGIPEIQKSYGSIMTAFDRKMKSKRLYIYNGNPDTYHGSFDEGVLSRILPLKADPLSYKYSQRDFASMHALFKSDNRLRFGQFKAIHQAYLQGSTTEADYNLAKEAHIAWLDTMRNLLTLFDIY